MTAYNLSYAGAMVSDTKDILHWIRALMTPGKILPLKQLQELTTYVSAKTGASLNKVSKEDPNGFGLGIYLSYSPECFSEPVITYAGMTVGFRAQYIYLKSKNIALAATVNSGVDSTVKDHLLSLLVEAYKAIPKK